MQLVGESRLRHSTSKLECVRIFRWFRNFRTSDLKEQEVSAVRYVRRDSWVLERTSLRESFRLQIWPRLSKITLKVPMTAYPKHTTEYVCSSSAGTVLRMKIRRNKIHATIIYDTPLDFIKLECVRMFRWFRNIRTSGLKEVDVAAVRSVRKDSWTYKMAPQSQKSRLQIWPILSKSPWKRPRTAQARHTRANVWVAEALLRMRKRSEKSTRQIQDMQFVGESWLRRSTSTLECVRMFRWFRNSRYQNYLKYVILSA